MFEEMIKKAVKPLLEGEYKRGYEAGVSAEKLVKEQEWADREYDLLRRGIEQGRDEMLKELEADVNKQIEELSAKEFAELAGIKEEPFGFVGDMEHMELVLDDIAEALEEVPA